MCQNGKYYKKIKKVYAHINVSVYEIKYSYQFWKMETYTKKSIRA